jgi:hypothetical protein
MKKKGRIGSSFDEFLKEKGIYEEVTVRAIKRVIARQLDALMQDQGLTKSTLAKRMKTSRAQLDRLLDPDNDPSRSIRSRAQPRPSDGICAWNWFRAAARCKPRSGGLCSGRAAFQP